MERAADVLRDGGAVAGRVEGVGKRGVGRAVVRGVDARQTPGRVVAVGGGDPVRKRQRDPPAREVVGVGAIVKERRPCVSVTARPCLYGKKYRLCLASQDSLRDLSCDTWRFLEIRCSVITEQKPNRSKILLKTPNPSRLEAQHLDYWNSFSFFRIGCALLFRVPDILNHASNASFTGTAFHFSNWLRSPVSRALNYEPSHRRARVPAHPRTPGCQRALFALLFGVRVFRLRSARIRGSGCATPGITVYGWATRRIFKLIILNHLHSLMYGVDL